MDTIQVINLTRNYGNGKGVFHVSFSIPKGEVFGFLGPNGAGKTTTIRHLMGFLKPQYGICRIKGMNCWKHTARIQKELGYIPGEISFFGEMTGEEYLRFLQKYRGDRNRFRLRNLTERFELDPKAKIKKISKGMKQKIGIIAAFMHDPEILILDEPTSGLDPLMQNRFVELLMEEKENGKTILMSSHIFEEVERTCDRVGIIRNGKMVTVDDTQALRERHMKSYTVRLRNPRTAAQFAEDFHGIQSDRSPDIVTVTAKQTLEEIFLSYYGEAH